ncbi:MAG: hypothetical protein JNK48_12975 [Bryobacterales bacterium]|nr:hypothetical protein [Bryobacterales bacterium]
MTRLSRIIRAAALASTRSARSFRHFSGNNLTYAAVTLVFFLDPGAAVFLLILAAIILFLPSSSDPLAAIPGERLHLWPLTQWQLVALRIVGPLLNPLTWLLIVGLLWKRILWSLWLFAAAFFLTGFIGSHFRIHSLWVPRIPAGRLTHMLRKDLRQMVTALDFYCALLISVPAAWLRLTGQLPPAAHVPLTGLIVIIMSTIPLTLFGLESSAIIRYRIWPISIRWPIASKGLAYLLLMLLLTIHLSPMAALSAGFASLAFGQRIATRHIAPQHPWSFRTSAPFARGMTQMLVALAGFAVSTQVDPLCIFPCIIVYTLSLARIGTDMLTCD